MLLKSHVNQLAICGSNRGLGFRFLLIPFLRLSFSGFLLIDNVLSWSIFLNRCRFLLRADFWAFFEFLLVNLEIPGRPVV